MKVGDYVRTKCGIEKIQRIIPNDYDKENDYIELENCVFDGLEIQGFFTADEVKSSPNIIDLIEVGDYVNGDRVKALKGDIENHKINNEEDVIYTEYINDYDEWCGYEEEDIKSIVTKEQFESMKYRVGE